MNAPQVNPATSLIEWPADSPRTLLEIEAQCRELIDAADTANFLDIPDKAADAVMAWLCGRANDLRFRVANEPAETIEDIVAKLRVLQAVLTVWPDADEYYMPLVRSTLEGATRLAGLPDMATVDDAT